MTSDVKIYVKCKIYVKMYPPGSSELVGVPGSEGSVSISYPPLGARIQEHC